MSSSSRPSPRDLLGLVIVPPPRQVQGARGARFQDVQHAGHGLEGRRRVGRARAARALAPPLHLHGRPTCCTSISPLLDVMSVRTHPG